MSLNTNYYQGRVRVNSNYDMYRCNTFRQLAEAGILIPNQPIDESCFLFGCVNDQLSVPRFIKVYRMGNNDYKVTERYYKPPVNNYVPMINGENAVAFPTDWAFTVGERRVGMDATIGNVQNNTPIIEMKSKYYCFCVYVYYRDISSKTTDSMGNTVYNFGNGGGVVEYDTFISNYLSGLGTTYIVTGMYVTCYYGTGTRRSNFSDSLDILSTMGNVDFGVPTDLIDDTISSEDKSYYKKKLLLPRRFTGSYARSLLQGSGEPFGLSPSVPYSKIGVIVRANPLFWKIARVGTEPNSFAGITYIDNETDLTLAYHAYRATGFYYFGNSNDAYSYDLDNIDPNNPPERGATGTDGKVDGVKGADGDSTGLSVDPATMYDTGFDGNANIDPNTYTDSTPLTKPKISTVGAFNRTFAVSYSSIKSLADWLWNADESVFDEIIKGLGLMGEIPIQGIVDVRMYPFNIATIITTAGEQTIRIGRTDSPVRGLICSSTDNAIIDLGSCTFTRKFKSFLDYSPYTEARLYIPYCGTIPIDSAEFMGHELSAKMIVDVVTGACTVLIYKDQIITYYAQGVCGVSIPFTGTDSAGYAQSVLNSVINGAVGIVGGAAGGDVGRVAGGAADLFSGFATPVQYATGGSSTPSCATWQPQYAYLIIDRPEPIPPDDYGHCVGYACEIYDSLSTFSGFTVISNPDLRGFTATETEKEMIKSLMQEGIYL